MHPQVWITGMGIISAIGNSPEDVYMSLSNLRTGIRINNLHDASVARFPVARVPLTNEEIFQLAGITLPQPFVSRTTVLGLYAARQALEQAGWEGKDLRDMLLVSSTTVSGMNLAEQFMKTGQEHGPMAGAVPTFDCADTAEVIAGYFGMHQATTICTACSSSANAIAVGSRMIRNGLCTKVLVGGSDSLTQFTLKGFHSLELLSPTGCRPFDADRNGVTIGEGSAFLVLESSRTASAEKALAILSSEANQCEAYHFTSSSPEGSGAIQTMNKALERSGLSGGDIGYINAHGTGTMVNDLSEGKAIEAVFGATPPPVSSTKGFTGHTLGAAGAIEAVISLLSIQHQMLPPNAGFEHPMGELSFRPVIRVKKARVKHVLSNSFGFGGNNSSLIFSRL